MLFAVLAAVVTAVLLILPFTKNTSFANIGVSFECWIVFAVFIIFNCDRATEAGLKTFVFFLISQPLIYLLQVPFSPMGWDLFSYYPRWFIFTVLCLPGGMLAWLVKKQNAASALILSVATGLLGGHGVYYLLSCLRRFPYYLLSTVFCFAAAVFLIFLSFDRKHERIITVVLTAALSAASYFLMA